MILTTSGNERIITDSYVPTTYEAPITLEEIDKTIQEYNKSIKNAFNDYNEKNRRVKMNSDLGIRMFETFKKHKFPNWEPKLFEYTDQFYPIDAFCKDSTTNKCFGIEIKRRDEKFADDNIFTDLRLEYKKYREMLEHYGQFSQTFAAYYYFNFIFLRDKETNNPYVICYLFNIGEIFHNHPELKAIETKNKKISADVKSETIMKNTYSLDKKWAERYIYTKNGFFKIP